MRKAIFTFLTGVCGCSPIFAQQSKLSRQQRAEEVVKKYVIAHKWKEKVKDLKFTELDNNNVIGIIRNGFEKGTSGETILRKTLYFSLNKDLTKAGCCFTE